MLRNITPAQNRAQEFCKSDALAQTIQINYYCFFSHAQKPQKNYFLKI